MKMFAMNSIIHLVLHLDLSCHVIMSDAIYLGSIEYLINIKSLFNFIRISTLYAPI